ncbi:MAG: hypothetical protein AAGI03_00725 [Pseudomonadota bacterium]
MQTPCYLYHEAEAPHGRVFDMSAADFDTAALAADGWVDTPAKFRGRLEQDFATDPESMQKEALQRLAYNIGVDLNPDWDRARLIEEIGQKQKYDAAEEAPAAPETAAKKTPAKAKAS